MCENSSSHDFEDGNGYIVLKDGVNSIDGEIFNDCNGLTVLAIPDSVTEITIPYWTTDEYKELLPSNVWDKLKEILEPNTIYYEASEKLDRQWIDKNSISHEFASGKGKIKLKDDVSGIGKNAFSGCRGLTTIVIPDSVTKIEDNTFSCCSGLISVIIPNSITCIDEEAFSGCSGLTSVTIPNSVASIGYKAFYDCSKLRTINIPNSVKEIGDYAFYECVFPKDIKENIKKINENAFDDGCVNNYEYEPTEPYGDICDAFEGDLSALWNID